MTYTSYEHADTHKHTREHTYTIKQMSEGAETSVFKNYNLTLLMSSTFLEG